MADEAAVLFVGDGTSDLLGAQAEGAVASALGYVAWHAALLGEPLTARLVGAGTLVLGGVALALIATRRRAARRVAT